MFYEAVVALIGEVPLQFEPVLYAFSFIAFFWLLDGFFLMLRQIVGSVFN